MGSNPFRTLLRMTSQRDSSSRPEFLKHSSETQKTLTQINLGNQTHLNSPTRSPSDNVFPSISPTPDLSPPNPQTQPQPHQNHFRYTVPLPRPPARIRINRSRPGSLHHDHRAPAESRHGKPSLPGELAEPDPELPFLQPVASPHGVPKPSPRGSHQSPLRVPRRDLAAEHVRGLDGVAALVRHEAAFRVLGSVARRQEREAEQAGCEPL